MSKKQSHGHSVQKKMEPGVGPSSRKSVPSEAKTLEIVLKCDSYGSVEAILDELQKVESSQVKLKVIHADVGDVSKSDLLLASSGSRLIVGFDVGVMPKLEQSVKESGVEVRLYNVIYLLLEDMKELLMSWVPREASEKILGKGKITALFKGGRNSVIIGCEVQEGVVALGQNFRIIGAMGPVYTGKVDSLQMDHKPIRQAKAGQKIGLKVSHFKTAKIGDLVESFETVHLKGSTPWAPSGSILERFA